MGRFVIGYCYYAGRTASNVISSSQLREHLSHRKNEIEPSLTSWDDMDRCLVLPREKAIFSSWYSTRSRGRYYCCWCCYYGYYCHNYPTQSHFFLARSEFKLVSLMKTLFVKGAVFHFLWWSVSSQLSQGHCNHESSIEWTLVGEFFIWKSLSLSEFHRDQLFLAPDQGGQLELERWYMVWSLAREDHTHRAQSRITNDGG